VLFFSFTNILLKFKRKIMDFKSSPLGLFKDESQLYFLILKQYIYEQLYLISKLFLS